MGIPVYIFTGFLESGKTTLINETLNDPGFNSGERTLLLVCEEGIEEYDSEKAKYINTHIEYLKDMESGFAIEKLNEWNDYYTPERIMIEFNGTWNMTDFLNMPFPKDWEIAQIVASVDSQTFENYSNNMKSMMFEQLRYADLIIFNRCNESTKKSFLRSSVRAYNRSCQIIYENVNREVEDMGEDELPFDLNQDEIVIEPDDYGIWYMDALDHPRKYQGKKIQLKGIAFPTKQFGKPIVALGRYAMVCCANDLQFLGIGVIDNDGSEIEKGNWYDVKGEIILEYDAHANEDYISITKSTMTPSKPLEYPEVTF